MLNPFEHFWVLTTEVWLDASRQGCAEHLSFRNKELFVCYSSGCATISWSCCHNQDWHRHTDHNPHWLATWDQRLPLLSLSPPVATPLTLLLSLPCLSSSFCTSQCLCVCMFILCSGFTVLASYSHHLSSKDVPFGSSALASDSIATVDTEAFILLITKS